MTHQFKLSKGFDLPIDGEPSQAVLDSPLVSTVGLVGDDYIGMKPTMLVSEGDSVEIGQPLFTDKKNHDVPFTAPAAGKVVAVNRGAKRKFESIVIELGEFAERRFVSYQDHNLAQLSRDDVRKNLIDSGLWTTLRSRPFGKIPAPDSAPHAIFVTAIDTNPLAADPQVVLADKPAEFKAGLEVLSRLTDGVTYLCKASGATLPGEDLSCVEVAEFDGPHPAGLPGTHMHLLAPVSLSRSNWHVNYQDVVAIGHLFLTGQLSNERTISLAGPAVGTPRLVKTIVGANLTELCLGESQANVRTVSGSVLSGRKSAAPVDFLGRYDLQVTRLVEGNHRDFIGWMLPGFGRFSLSRVYASAWPPLNTPSRRFKFTTSTEGSHRAIVPLGLYEKVLPLDLMPTALLKSLCTGDTEESQMLGCLELTEEDLGLCTFVCPSKNEYGPMLRKSLTTIEVEG
ncbi:Na(+)-translocating NADH-quinone reductase subunit A [Pseudobythopirellula maris]|uniref:Na(+)-translocating NADH-quinone reductase subunit A n=1 Tax=Pseudobythopirellula maris TaxID=2527991 RepID=A0A5C5ZSL7_9BACT|nr:Na(+)-translocating NADH-quinone reductase subunit A [Pseudobythopirellula maris]TWT90226.1 Na(+)-translocating NADH-quinone reductase subunit A [Pseudobythopirellula maris]